jgi:hypothetical protein
MGKIGKRISKNLIPNKLFSNTLICPDTTYGDIAPGFEDGDDFEEVRLHGCAIGHYHRVITESVGQFTGLKDKNGKEIYEGDLVTIYDPYTKSQHTDQVIWDDNNCRFAIKNTYVDFDFLIVDELEIVGNIFQNPELLN